MAVAWVTAVVWVRTQYQIFRVMGTQPKKKRCLLMCVCVCVYVCVCRERERFMYIYK